MAVTAESVWPLKRKTIKTLQKLVRPYLYPSGYVDEAEPDKRFRIAVSHNRKDRKLRKALVLEPFHGFCKEGVLTDAWAGGIITTYWKDLPVEDLLRLQRMLEQGQFKFYVPKRPDAGKGWGR